jgi:hypothetical protein
MLFIWVVSTLLLCIIVLLYRMHTNRQTVTSWPTTPTTFVLDPNQTVANCDTPYSSGASVPFSQIATDYIVKIILNPGSGLTGLIFTHSNPETPIRIKFESNPYYTIYDNYTIAYGVAGQIYIRYKIDTVSCSYYLRTK